MALPQTVVIYISPIKKFALSENLEKGRLPQDIFITEGIPVSVIGSGIPERAVGSWRNKMSPVYYREHLLGTSLHIRFL